MLQSIMFKGVPDLPTLGRQDGTYHRNGPQPLGMFMEAHVYPQFTCHNAVENVIEISKSGFSWGK